MEGKQEMPVEEEINLNTELVEGVDFSILVFTVIVGAMVLYYFWNKVFTLVLLIFKGKINEQRKRYHFESPSNGVRPHTRGTS